MVELHKGDASLTVVAELVETYKAMGWSEKAEAAKPATVKKKATNKAESET